MLLLAALAVVLLALAALGGICDRLGPEDPVYATAAALIPARCCDQMPSPDPTRRRSTAA